MRIHKKRIKNRTKQLKSDLFLFLLLTLCGLFIVQKSEELKSIASLTLLHPQVMESDEFRDQQLSDETIAWLQEKAVEFETDFALLLTVCMLEEEFILQYIPDTDYTLEDFQADLKKWQQKEEAFALLYESYQMIWNDLVYFPVPDSTLNADASFSYSDSWMAERSYGGNRSHEGTDIMAGINEQELYPILSMTSGVVENIGWLEKGGYRIGIRSPGGAYFYYAHLSSYGPDISEGSEITAGQLIGWMGSTGYGPEGTDDQFDVHLHLGIYITTPELSELSINPYYVLRSLDNSRLKYAYGADD